MNATPPPCDCWKAIRVTVCAMLLYALLGVGVVAWFSPQPPASASGDSEFFKELQHDYARARQKQTRLNISRRTGFMP